MNNKKVFVNYLFRDIFFSDSDFCILHICLILFQKCFWTFHSSWHIFSALDQETKEQIKSVKDKI